MASNEIYDYEYLMIIHLILLHKKPSEDLFDTLILSNHSKISKYIHSQCSKFNFAVLLFANWWWINKNDSTISFKLSKKIVKDIKFLCNTAVQNVNSTINFLQRTNYWPTSRLARNRKYIQKNARPHN